MNCPQKAQPKRLAIIMEQIVVLQRKQIPLKFFPKNLGGIMYRESNHSNCKQIQGGILEEPTFWPSEENLESWI